MGKNAKLNAKDTVSARLAECYVKINGNRYNFMQAINLEAKAEKNKIEVPILGRISKGNKSGSLKYTGKAKFHFNTSMFNKIMKDYKDIGEDLYFDIQVINEDPTSKAGKQEVWLYDCNLDGVTLTQFDADGDYLSDEINFTFEDWDMTAEFNQLDGML